MSELQNISISKVSELSTRNREHFREQVEELDLTIEDMKALKEAEESGKNRKDLLEFLDDQINSEKVGQYLGIAEADIDELESVFEKIDSIEDVKSLDEDYIEIEQDRLLDLVGGTVDEIKEFIEENSLNSQQLKNILEAEKRVKDRKTARSFLEKQLRDRKVSEDSNQVKKEIKKLKEEIDQLEEDKEIDVEKIEPNDDLKNAMKDLKGENSSGAGTEDLDAVEDALKDEDSKEEDIEEESDSDSQENNDDDQSETVESQDDEADDNEEDYLERKKEIAEELDLDMDEDQLKEYPLDELEDLEDEKQHREELIKTLKDDQDMDEVELRKASTSDLEKIANSFEPDESTEDMDEMREEAEEDLEMLMGAVRWDDEEEDDEDTSHDPREKLQDLKSQIKDKLDRSGKKEKKGTGLDPSKTEEVLNEYRDLKNEEAAVKTAHIMKGFLEQSLELKREMTYKELAKNMPKDKPGMEKLANFFLKMHREQYTGKLDIDDSNDFIDTCIKVLNQF